MPDGPSTPTVKGDIFVDMVTDERKVVAEVDKSTVDLTRMKRLVVCMYFSSFQILSLSGAVADESSLYSVSSLICYVQKSIDR